LKIVVVAGLIVSVAAIVTIKQRGKNRDSAAGLATPVAAAAPQASGLPRLVDLGADKCIPCKMMAPVLEELKSQYKGRLDVVFIDVWKNPNAGGQYGIKLIPTQILYDAAGKELFRHEGFFSKEDILAKFKESGVDLSDSATQTPVFERLTPAKPDERPRDTVCYMCDGNIDTKTLVTVQTDKGPVKLCSPHCYFIMYTCLTEDKTGFEKKVTVTDWTTGKPVPITEAAFLCGEKDRLTKKPIVVKTFEGKVASLEPTTAVAWFGQRQKPDGTWASAGCFHQGFFTTADNLKKWVEQNPSETGRLIPISQALADKMKLSPEQIQKACKIGECVPK
jgi:thioredoxin 1